jgi:septal ring factor EnvC (AmiA/AmiB activator)
MTIQEKLNEVETRFNQNIAQAQQLEQQIAKLQEELRGLQQPLIEDQGAIRSLKEIVEPVVTAEQTT